MNELITMNEVLYLHDLGIEAFGGSFGLRDKGLLESALAQPNQTFDGEELHPHLFDKVAALEKSLISNHPFVDGNKRVGFAAMAAVLKRNGYNLNCDADEGEKIAIRVAAGGCDREELAAWIKEHARESEG